MTVLVRGSSVSRWLMIGIGACAAGYGALATAAWARYGKPARPGGAEGDVLLDRFMPAYDVVERHCIWVNASADITFAAAGEQDLLRSPVIRAIFKARELALGASPDTRAQPHGLLATMQSLGWGVLAEAPGREIVVGAVTRPWEANVTFHALPADQFAAFRDPGFVKIVWTLRVDPHGTNGTVFRTETRAVATDPDARAKFRRYWAFASPGIAAIRWLSLWPLKRDAERRASELRGNGAGKALPRSSQSPCHGSLPIRVLRG